MAKVTTKNITEKDSLAKELKSLIPKLDEEGLAFLIKQAQIHLYNMQVDALNQTMIKEENRKKASAAVKKTESQKKAVFSDIKPGAGSGYHVLYDNEWLAFTGSEIVSLVKVALGEGSEMEIRARLYNWLVKERADLLNTASIANKFDKKLDSLTHLLQSHFTLTKSK